MDRVKVNLPESFHFSTNIRIRITDLNYGGHVGNDTFLALVHEARQQYLHHLGYTEMDVAGVSLIMADAAIEFKRELAYADEVKISVCAASITKVGFSLFYLLETLKDGQTHVAGKVKTAMLAYDYGKGKMVALPEEAKARLV